MKYEHPYIIITKFQKTFIFVVCFFLILITGIINYSQKSYDLIMIHFGFVLFILVLLLPFLIIRNTFLGWFHPLIFTVLWWGIVREVLPTLPMVMYGLEFHKAEPTASKIVLNQVVAYSYFLYSIWYLMLYIGYIVGSIILNKKFPRYKNSKQMFRARFIEFKLLLIGAISIAAFSRYVYTAGGLTRLLLQRGIPAEMRAQTLIGGHLEPIVRMWSIALLMAYAIEPKLGKRPLYWIMFMSALFINFSLSGSRSNLILSLFMLFSIWILINKKLPVVRLLIIGIISLALLGLLGEFRYASFSLAREGDFLRAIEQASQSNSLQSGLHTVFYYGGEINGLYGILLKVPHKVVPLMGKTYMSILALPFPRKLFPNKPEAGGKITAQLIFNRYDTAIPPGSVGEAYLNFHFIGVVIIPILFGIFLAYLGRLYLMNSSHRIILVIYVITLFLLQPNSEAIYKWCFAIVPAMLSAIILTGFRSYFSRKLSKLYYLITIR